ncbi:MAG: hypothetical protein ACI4WT_05325 [Oligosphaeraceae bacterium]
MPFFHESIIQSAEPPAGSDVAVPLSVCAYVAVVERDGDVLWRRRLTDEAGQEVDVSACRLLFVDNRLLVYGTALGCRLYAEDGQTFEALPCQQVVGRMAYASAIRTLFYVRTNEGGGRSLYSFSLATAVETSLGLHLEATLSDYGLAVSADGRTLLYRHALKGVSVACLGTAGWETRQMLGEEMTGSLSLSARGDFACWQSGQELVLYDVVSGVQRTLALTEASLPVLSASGYALLYVASEGATGRRVLFRNDALGNALTLEVRPGWGAYGLPFELDENSWSALRGLGELFVFENGRYVRLERRPKACEGFLLNASSAHSLRLTGRLATAEELGRGWNLVSGEARTDGARCFRLDVAAGAYVRSDGAPNQGEGYWVYRGNKPRRGDP